jgi:hypothetical protein
MDAKLLPSNFTMKSDGGDRWFSIRDNDDPPGSNDIQVSPNSGLSAIILPRPPTMRHTDGQHCILLSAIQEEQTRGVLSGIWTRRLWISNIGGPLKTATEDPNGKSTVDVVVRATVTALDQKWCVG